MMKVYVANDHAGFLFKNQILTALKPKLTQFEFVDLGSFDEKSVDYPDMANLVAEKVQDGKSVGILVCGSGIGMCIRANRFKNVRAAQCWDLVSTRLSRTHNDANVLCLGARLIPLGLACDMVEEFLSTEFEGGRHLGRVKKLE